MPNRQAKLDTKIFFCYINNAIFALCCFFLNHRVPVDIVVLVLSIYLAVWHVSGRCAFPSAQCTLAPATELRSRPVACLKSLPHTHTHSHSVSMTTELRSRPVACLKSLPHTHTRTLRINDNCCTWLQLTHLLITSNIFTADIILAAFTDLPILGNMFENLPDKIRCYTRKMSLNS